MKEILGVTIGSALLLLGFDVFAQDEASEWIEEPATQQASENAASGDRASVKESKKKEKTKTTDVEAEGQGTLVDDGSVRTVVIDNQATAFAPPPPPPPPPRVKPRVGAHTHDGFYFRGGVDLGAMVLTNASNSSPKANMVSFAAGMNFGFGGTLGKGFVLGGRIDIGGGPGPTLYTDEKNYALKGELGKLDVQLFGDWYVFPKKGFHVEAGIGWGTFRYDPTPNRNTLDVRNDNEPDDAQSIGGVTGIVGAGYEWWVAEEWSLGALFRLNWGAYKGQIGDSGSVVSIEQVDGKGSLMMLTPMVGFTVTYH